MNKKTEMINKCLVITSVLFMFLIPVKAQGPGPKREVTLYNPYKPSLPEAKKRSFLPDMIDTAKVSPDFKYDIRTTPFMPEYTISPIKAASLLPDPLPKLYKSYVNLGFGNYTTPLAEISITNERSKKGAIGLYARHMSSNGNIKLENDKKVYAGYMDNDVSLFGKKFFRKSILDGSIDFSQRRRHAYGHDTAFFDYNPENKDVRLTYNNIGVKATFASSTLDSSTFSYRFDVNYDYFYQKESKSRNNAGFKGWMAKSYRDLYLGSGIEFDHYTFSENVWDKPKYTFAINPFLTKQSSQWHFRLGLQAVLDRNLKNSTEFYLYPDINFGFTIVPSYLSFFTGLSGSLDKNDPATIIEENPFLIPDGRLFNALHTDNEIVITAGLKGNTGMNGNYLLSSSYSVINDMLFYSNLVYSNLVDITERGNHFVTLTDNVEVLNLHGEMSGTIKDKIVYQAKGNFYKYTLSGEDYAWNKPAWDAKLGLKYNLRDKILAGVEFVALGSRKQIVTRDLSWPVITVPPTVFERPAHFNLNLLAEYRYSKILSFWVRFNNISGNRFYEWAYYPTQRFQGMIGFTYSL